MAEVPIPAESRSGGRLLLNLLNLPNLLNLLIMNILCLGASYTGRFLSVNFSSRHRVRFLTRRRGEQAAALSIYSPGDPVDAILDTVPFAAADGVDRVEADHSPPEKGLRLMERLGRPYRREVEQILEDNPALPFAHISSTSLFPQGERAAALADLPRFDENSPPNPDSHRGELRLALEEYIRKLYPKALIVRSTAIYGPGRSILEQFQAQNFRRATVGNRVISRIHVYDLCQLILALFQAQPSLAPRLTHAVDEEAAPYSQVFAWLEQELGIRVPHFCYHAPPTGRIIASLYARGLLKGYQYPTYRQGFADLLRQQSAQSA